MALKQSIHNMEYDNNQLKHQNELQANNSKNQILMLEQKIINERNEREEQMKTIKTN